MAITKLPAAYKYLKETRHLKEIMDSLTRGFQKVMKRAPDDAEKFKIKREAIQKYQNERKVIKADFNPNKKLEQAGKKKLRGDESFDELLDLGKKGILDDDVPFNQGGITRVGYGSGKKVWPPKGANPDGSFDPGTVPENWLHTMPQIDPFLQKLIKEYKKRKGLAEILEV